MNIQRVPNQIVVEADILSKETHLPFRECVELLMTLHTQVEEVTLPSPKCSICIY
jgi:hypothetical protein